MGQSIKLILWVEFGPYYKDFCEINQAAFVKFSSRPSLRSHAIIKFARICPSSRPFVFIEI